MKQKSKQLLIGFIGGAATLAAGIWVVPKLTKNLSHHLYNKDHTPDNIEDEIENFVPVVVKKEKEDKNDGGEH